VVGGGDIPIGAAGVTGIEGDFPYTIYIDRMRVLISQRFLRPQAGGNTLTSTVSFTINRDGAIRDAKTEIPSGDGTFDRAALRAVLEASPLPPLPFGYNGTYLGVHLTFR
jgi:TonB family protein